MRQHPLDDALKRRLWVSFKLRCDGLHLDYQRTTLAELVAEIESEDGATADAQCLRMLHALHVAQGRVHDVLIPLDADADAEADDEADDDTPLLV